MMFAEFQKIYKALEGQDIENPLEETLKLYDILSKRAISMLDKNIYSEMGVSLDRLASERKKGLPTEYIIGKAPFMGQFFYCSPDALIPRAETELLTQRSIDLIKTRWPEQDQVSVIDMGTGCGNIAVSIALNVKWAKVLACDLNDGHMAIAKKNVQNFNLQGRITLFCGDLFGPIENKGYDHGIDMIVCNPPYIPTGSLNKLDPEIKDNEPVTAFDGGPFGIDIYRRLINDAVKFLKSSGILIFEIGVGQKDLVGRLIKRNGNYRDIEYFDDGEQVRVVKAVCQGPGDLQQGPETLCV
jgi:release factor glutamine methyltransferase